MKVRSSLSRRALYALAAFALLAGGGCGFHDSGFSPIDQARAFCVESGGQVVAVGTGLEEQCVLARVATFDSGTQTYTTRCEVAAFFAGRCDEGAESGSGMPFVSAGPAPTAREKLYATVHDILSKVENTGYSHNKDGNFMLAPSVQDLAATGSANVRTFNLFLDCSGFVGYYALQAVRPDLYQAIPTNYMCAERPRPLAADFADKFKAAPSATGLVELGADEPGGCWARVDHVSQARPGDVLVYYHDRNITGQTCCYRNDQGSWTTDDLAQARCADLGGRMIGVLDGNSGHILYVMKTPKRAEKTYDDEGALQWIVHVADSTTVPHSFDSRKQGDESSSNYEGNVYHAWRKGTGTGMVERCADGAYRRDCSAAGSYAMERATIDTMHEDTPTGIGAGVMYVDDDMIGYRSAFSSNHVSDDRVFIGRPARCP